MQVEVVRSGGVAGLRETVASYDTEALGAADSSWLRETVARLMATSAPESIGADGFTWKTTVREDGGERTVVVAGEVEPESAPVRELLEGPVRT
jgi:hypothetical protein